MTDRLEKSDYTQYVKQDYRKNEKCTASCLEELKNCEGYKPMAFDFMDGCVYCGRSGKCLRPEVNNANK